VGVVVGGWAFFETFMINVRDYPLLCYSVLTYLTKSVAEILYWASYE
jgi:hypothetical protein